MERGARLARRVRSLLLPFLCACAPDGPQGSGSEASADPFTVPGCGNAVLEPNEWCDDGAQNSDVSPDACRTSCVQAACGDGVVDAGESCDDGDDWGGDGCTPLCVSETGTLEVEPNGDLASANPSAESVHGALTAGDEDCWSVVVPECGAVSASQALPCVGGMTLALVDPAGNAVASGGPDADGCAQLDPVDEPGARWIAAGTWAVCASQPIEAEVRAYQLSVTSVDPVAAGLPSSGPDLDLDGVPNSCDTDRDGDGVPDAEDNCVDVSNGPNTGPLVLSGNGYVRSWLANGPYTTGVSDLDCRPSWDAFVGEDGFLAPSIGDVDGEFPWTAEFPVGDVFDFLPSYGFVYPAREVYAFVYLDSDVTRDATLSIGADDGVFAWWNGDLVLNVSSCQGVNADQFQAPVQVLAGPNALLFKVRDQGGGWGLMAHLLDAGGAPLTSLTPGLELGEVWIADQSDGDADGVGDVCDDSP